MVEYTWEKIFASVALVLFPIILGLLPIHLYKLSGGETPKWATKKFYNLVLTILSCFGGGVILGSSFFHMLPEVRTILNCHETILENVSYLPEIIVLGGLALIYTVEEIAHLIMSDNEEDEIHQESESAVVNVARHNSIARGILMSSGSGRNITPGLRHPLGIRPSLLFELRDSDSDSEHGRMEKRKSLRTQRFRVMKSLETRSAPGTPPIPRPRSNRSDSIDTYLSRPRNSLLFTVTEGKTSTAPPPNNNNEILERSTSLFSSSQHLVHNGHVNGPKLLAQNNSNEPHASSVIKSLLALVLLSIQSFMEGIAIGIQKTPSATWLLFGAVAVHKFVVSFMMGMEMSHSKAKKKTFIGSMFFFAIVSPIGIIIGTIVDILKFQHESLAVVQGVAAGTLLFVAFFEVLQRERERKALSFKESKSIGFIQIMSLVVGVGIMAWLFQIIEHYPCNEKNNQTTSDFITR